MYNLLIFSFIVSAFYVSIRNLAHPQVINIFPILSSRSISFSLSIFIFTVHLELIFMYGVR